MVTKHLPVRKRLSIAEACETLSEVIAELRHAPGAIVVECDGEPVAAIVPPSELGNEATTNRNAFTAAGALDDLTDSEWDAFVEGLEVARGRPFPELHRSLGG